MNCDAQSRLPRGWDYRPLTELVSNIVDNRGRTAPTALTGIPLIATNCIKNENFYPTKEKVRFVSKETHRDWFRGHPQPGDIIIVNKDTPGLVNMVPLEVDFCFAQDMVALRPDRDVVDGEYLFAALRSSNFSAQVQAFNVGTTIPHLKKQDFSRLMIPLPPRPSQERIGHLYCDLWRKTESNRRINGLLLNMARALFQHWFVDFGPFQQRGLKDSDIGPIPKGWTAQPILDCCTLLSGGTPKTSVDEYWNGDVLWASAKDVSQCGASYLLDTERKITRLGVENSATKILPEGTVVVVARGSVGEYAMLGRDMAMNQTCYGLRGKDGFSQPWVYLTLANTVARLKQSAYGTIFDTITTTTFQTTNIVVPPCPVLDEFTDKVKPLFDQMLANLKENQILAQTRDYLLPKLLSGEIELNEAAAEI